MKICYEPRKFSPGSRAIIEKVNEIVEEYQQQGLDLTLRQVYYQFVSKGLIANNIQEYKRLGSIINDGRMAGEISWAAIEDRTRNIRSNSHWNSPAKIIRACSQQYREDLWANQDFYIEVWIEKDALVGVLDAVCPKNDCPYFSCRGYTSQSEMWAAAMRLNRAARINNRTPVIIHLGDHDPSGVDMSRDIKDRLNIFSTASFSEPPKFDLDWVPCSIEVRRIALSIQQVRQYEPPPNPAKMTDSRAKDYVELFGDESWELDALEPRKLIALIQKEIDSCRDAERWEESIAQQDAGRAMLVGAAMRLEGPSLDGELNEMKHEAIRDRRKAAKNSVAWGNADGRVEAITRVQDFEEQFRPPKKKATEEEADDDEG